MDIAFLSYLWGIETEEAERVYKEVTSSFLSYLWGIETIYSHFIVYVTTSFYRTYEELKLYTAMLAIQEGLMFLSYLWGIETWFSQKNGDEAYNRFYRTYEELKHNSLELLFYLFCCFYRTYEELKQTLTN